MCLLRKTGKNHGSVGKSLLRLIPRSNYCLNSCEAYAKMLVKFIVDNYEEWLAGAALHCLYEKMGG